MLDYDKESRVEQLEGSAATGTTQAFSRANDADIEQLNAKGFDPNSGAFQAAISANATKKASVTADNVIQTGQAIQDQKVQGMKNVVAIGNGQAAESLAGLSDIASASAAKANNDAENKAGKRRANAGAVGFAAGAGAKAALGYAEDDDE